MGNISVKGNLHVKGDIFGGNNNEKIVNNGVYVESSDLMHSKGEIIGILNELKGKINETNDLDKYSRNDAINYIDRTNEEINKGNDKQDTEAIKHYLGKVMEIVKNIDPLIASVTNLSILIGIKL